MHEACKAKYGCGIDKSKTTVSLCTSSPLFCLRGGVTEHRLNNDQSLTLSLRALKQDCVFAVCQQDIDRANAMQS